LITGGALAASILTTDVTAENPDPNLLAFENASE
jgi:hypothetical protein